MFFAQNSNFKKGLKLRNDLDDAPTVHDTHGIALLSVDVEDLLKDDSKLEAYACLAYQFDALSRYGIFIKRDIASFDKVFYVVHKVDNSQYYYFKKIHDYWGHLTFYAEKEASWDEADLEYHRKTLEAVLVHEHDVIFADIGKEEWHP